MGKPQRPVPNYRIEKPTTSSKTIEVRPVEEKLDKAGTKKQHIEIDSNVPAEGHTNPDKKDGHNLQTKHKTVAHTSMQHDQHVVGKKKRRISKDISNRARPTFGGSLRRLATIALLWSASSRLRGQHGA